MNKKIMLGCAESLQMLEKIGDPGVRDFERFVIALGVKI